MGRRRKGKRTGVVLWEGLSRIDGKPIVVIATLVTDNPKTGDMVQTWILRADVEPHVAVKTGEDASICGGCIHRGNGGKGRTCYVTVHRAPLGIYRAYKRGSYLRAEEVTEEFTGRKVRLGSYGDPAAVPSWVWERLTRDSSGWTGYTHQWRSERFRDALGWCQASVDSPEDVERLRALDPDQGYFRVVPLGEGLLPGEILCPASEEGGKLTDCEHCLLCDGTAKVAIYAHGATAARYTGRRLPVLREATS